MFISQRACGGADQRDGSCRSLAGLRRRLSDPSTLDEGDRQRLLDLAQRLARVQALGDGHGRVEFSPQAQFALRALAAC
ncbi:MAG TPA: hypothetical protein PLF81_30160 [Candidatus Anammoximicrobium sp.]|nr:hypothetical protein [Candidatus Anammoximicrobium sp.]